MHACTALIAQGKISEFQRQCSVLEKVVESDAEPTVVNNAAWVSSVSPQSGANFDVWIKRLGPIARARKSAYYWNTLAMLHYRAKNYSESIRCANASMKLGLANSAPYDWIVKAFCYLEQEQGSERSSSVQAQLDNTFRWFDSEKLRIKTGFESQALQSKEKSFMIPMLLRELQSKMTSVEMGTEAGMLDSMLHQWPEQETTQDGQP